MDKKKILIVEDDKAVADLEKIILENEGFHCTVARDGAEALEEVKQNGYDVIISDRDLPRVDGEDFYKEMLKLNGNLARKIMFTSGNITDFIISTGNPFLEKPFSSEQLVKEVKKLIS
jgi:DNA-binding response OmpR family regulator